MAIVNPTGLSRSTGGVVEFETLSTAALGCILSIKAKCYFCDIQTPEFERSRFSVCPPSLTCVFVLTVITWHDMQWCDLFGVSWLFVLILNRLQLLLPLGDVDRMPALQLITNFMDYLSTVRWFNSTRVLLIRAEFSRCWCSVNPCFSVVYLWFISIWKRRFSFSFSREEQKYVLHGLIKWRIRLNTIRIVEITCEFG